MLRRILQFSLISKPVITSHRRDTIWQFFFYKKHLNKIFFVIKKKKIEHDHSKVKHIYTIMNGEAVLLLLLCFVSVCSVQLEENC